QVQRLVKADAGGFAAYLAMLSAYPVEAEAALHALHEHLERSLPAGPMPVYSQGLAQQQAQAAVAVLYLGRAGPVWPLVHQRARGPRRTYLTRRWSALQVDWAVLANRLLGGEEKDPSVRQGLLLALGEYQAHQRAEVMRGPLVERVLRAYRDDPDPGVHSAA